MNINTSGLVTKLMAFFLILFIMVGTAVMLGSVIMGLSYAAIFVVQFVGWWWTWFAACVLSFLVLLVGGKV